jgi:hypothetical protein
MDKVGLFKKVVTSGERPGSEHRVANILRLIVKGMLLAIPASKLVQGKDLLAATSLGMKALAAPKPNPKTECKTGQNVV